MKSQIECPKCGEEIDVNNVLTHQLEKSIRQEFLEKDNEAKEALLQKEQKLAEERAEFARKQKEADEQYQDRLDKAIKEKLSSKEAKIREKLKSESREELTALNKELDEKSEQLKELSKSKAEIERLKREKNEISETIKAEQLKAFNEKLKEEVSKAKTVAIEANGQKLKKLRDKYKSESQEELQALNKELNEKSEKLKELSKSKAEIERLKREKNEMEDAVRAEQEKNFNEKLKEERAKIKKSVDEEYELILREKQKQLDDQKKLTEEMKRKQEQGSMQLQGEVQELAIEEWLASQFPLDTIDDVKKGVHGADCLHTVNTYEALNCGTIYYESKRAKNFSNAWIPKFKEDMARKGAPLGVLVTEVLPNDMDRMGMIEKNVWVCTYPEFKSLCAVLRQSVIAVNSAVATQANKGDKMALLYDYLTGSEFRMQIEAIKDAFIEMEDDLRKEQRAAYSRWKRRQKQIEKVMINTTGMYGSLRGIAGNSVPLIADLEEAN